MLGTRKAESSGRAHRMTALEAQRVRDLLSPNAALPNCLVYSPVENWSNDDVWTFLMQTANPWGYSNKDLLSMYQGASPDGECPLVVDASTPSCGDSRFGCWVCTLVDKDKSMSAMIQNDEEKEWMLPLLELRNELDVADDRHLRDFRRMNGTVQLFHDQPIPGPYTQEARERWLRKLLEAQTWIRGNGPAHVRSLELITLEELEEIRRIWVVDKHEFEDRLPAIYTGSNRRARIPAGRWMSTCRSAPRSSMSCARSPAGTGCTSRWSASCWTSSSATGRKPAGQGCSTSWRRRCGAASTTTKPTPPAMPSAARDTAVRTEDDGEA